MFKPAPLWNVVVIFPKKFQDELLKEMGREGIAEIRKPPGRVEKSHYFKAVEAETGEIAKVLMGLDREIARLGVVKGERRKEREEPVREAEELLEKLRLEEEGVRSLLKEERERKEHLRRELEMVRSLEDLKLEYQPHLHLAVMSPSEWEKTHKRLESRVGTFTSLREAVSVSRELVAVISTEKDSKKIGSILSGFRSGPADVVAEEIGEEREEIEASIEEEEEKLKRLPEEYGPDLLALREQLEFMLKRENQKRKLVESKFSSALTCWVSKKEYQVLKNLVWRVCGPHAAVFIEEPKPEEAPTKLENPLPFRPFETFLYQFSLPSYDEIDPTPIIALVFPLFFGMMLSDGGYGTLLLPLSLAMRRKKDLKPLGNILLPCAISTILFGFVFGSWFGYPLTGPQIDPLRKPLLLMGLTLLVGFFYVNLGLLLGVAQRWVKEDWEGMAEEEGLWLVFEAGLAAMVVGEWVFGGVVAGGAVFFRLWRKGVLKILDFPKFFSTFVSFVRLAALAMATAWIAFTVNLLFSVLRPIPYGLIPGVLVLAGGHLFNFGFNAFGAFLQAMRLHYVEFLGQFFQGNGRAMEVFKLTREHTLEVK